MILFAIKKDQVLNPHSAPMSTPLLVLEGSAKVTIGDEEFVLYEGAILYCQEILPTRSSLYRM
jgi:quercetin dioxygenase-like cupin family protein